ncbi:sigma-70 family RNA polymerase sigma factor [Polaribacter batillariae]|uniref:Sigma-70 family RNA polymerase sigma factor n=1 Tax=Polaribacter batillariae TaxID=2808900 RepID=A0ABX7SYE1_9FLAO|nr:sigma-70 family RNA polymerase sigma factor [Polaribacter batillariae]
MFNSFKIQKKEEAFLEQIKIETAFEIFTFDEEELSKEEEVKKMVNKLSTKCKEAFVLSKYENMKYKAIALKMGISVKTVENHISKAYAELRKNLHYLKLFFF